MAGRDPDDEDARAIPASRAGRLARMARLAGGVAGGMVAEGARQWREGKRPSARDLLLTPGNAKRVADQLATMRGAAMKVGQILSMDTGDFLPRELADILAPLRANARFMPRAQVRQAMCEAYGEGWESQFARFQYRPLAAASIGQVHRAETLDGRDIVLKVQYPGVAASIDADVDNIASLLRISGLLPAGVDIQPLLDDAKAQLHDEADYFKEADYLAAFGELLATDERFLMPEVLPELTRRTVLAMTWVGGAPIDTILEQPAHERDRVVGALIELMFRELFELRMVQTDPNFANYHYEADCGRIVLLDFGATRRFKAGFVKHYRSLAKAAMAGNHERMLAAAERLGYATGDEDSAYRQLVLDLFLLALEPLQQEGPYDFATSDMLPRMSELAERVGQFRDFWRAPPTDAVYFHRKLGGMFLLASRLQARVDVRELISRYV